MKMLPRDVVLSQDHMGYLLYLHHSASKRYDVYLNPFLSNNFLKIEQKNTLNGDPSAVISLAGLVLKHFIVVSTL